MTTVADILRIAASQNGYTESGSNLTKYWLVLDSALQGNPWCAAYVSWVFGKAGCPLPNMGKDYGYSYVPAAMAYAKANGLWDASGKYSPGDIICYGKGSHTGIVVTDDGNRMSVYEGNTSPDDNGSQTNGGQVALKHRTHGAWVDGVIKTAKWLAETQKDVETHPIPTTLPTTPKSTTHPKPAPPKPSAIPVVKRPPQIAVDGIFGVGTKKRFQQWAGVYPDGKLGKVSWMAIQRKVRGLTVDGFAGEKTWKAIQELIGAKPDGFPGDKTYRALQNYLNKH